jgi:uncharacterized protein (DUF952 family)
MVTATDNPVLIYKIASGEVARAADAAGLFTGMPIDEKDGYLHFSTAAQLRETLRLHFRGQSDLVVMALPTAALGETLRWEPSRGGQLFPHVYGTFRMDQVAHCAVVSLDAGGDVELPEWAQ